MESGKGNLEVLRRKRKMLLLLPVIMIPLLTLGFYALGGGKGGHSGFVWTKGLNMSLPEAKFKEKKKSMNKMGVYKQSDEDSVRLRESRKMDPYYAWKDSAALRTAGMEGSMDKSGISSGPLRADVQAETLRQQLEQLKGVLSRQQKEGLPSWQPGGQGLESSGYPARMPSVNLPGSFAPSTERVAEGDPDLDKLNTLMDKVLKVRYPGDASLGDTAGRSATRRVEILSAPMPEETMNTLLSESNEDVSTGFIELEDGYVRDTVAENLIAAAVDGDQSVVSGEAVTFRTCEEAMLGGVRVPKGTSVAGRAVLSGERLLVSVTSVRIDNRVIPAALEVIDMDGMTGIRMKGSINRDVSKESAGEAVSSLGMTSMDGGVAGQATAAGIQTAKNLLSRKLRLVRTVVPDGYRVLLRNSKINH